MRALTPSEGDEECGDKSRRYFIDTKFAEDFTAPCRPTTKRVQTTRNSQQPTDEVLDELRASVDNLYFRMRADGVYR